MAEFIFEIKMFIYQLVNAHQLTTFWGRTFMEDGMIMGIMTMVFIVLPTIIGITILIGLKILKGNKTKVSPAADVDETKMIQEIYHSLSRMEERVNTLETILLEKERKPGGNHEINHQ